MYKHAQLVTRLMDTRHKLLDMANLTQMPVAICYNHFFPFGSLW